MGAWVSSPLIKVWGGFGHILSSLVSRKSLHDGMSEPDVESSYSSKAKHKQLFQPADVDSWFVPEFLSALSLWHSSGNAADIDISDLPRIRLEAPGVISFDCLKTDFCDLLLAEVEHYQRSGLPQHPPNSMNNYGLVLNEIGMRKSFDAVLQRHLLGIAARLFGDDAVRESRLNGHELKTENWGGSSLDDHHTFVVRYRPDEDSHLDMHVDACDVTFNFGLSDTSRFSGSDLAFCGMHGQEDRRKHLHTYKHVKGRCVVHSGKRRHGALRIKDGERSSLIMWTRSDEFRWTPEYQQMWGGISKKEAGLPDLICLSKTHDWDYDFMSRKVRGEEEPPMSLQDPVATLDGKVLLPIRSRRD